MPNLEPSALKEGKNSTKYSHDGACKASITFAGILRFSKSYTRRIAVFVSNGIAIMGNFASFIDKWVLTSRLDLTLIIALSFFPDGSACHLLRNRSVQLPTTTVALKNGDKVNFGYSLEYEPDEARYYG